MMKRNRRNKRFLRFIDWDTESEGKKPKCFFKQCKGVTSEFPALVEQ